MTSDRDCGLDDSWRLVAKGEIGAEVSFEPEFRVLSDVREVFCHFEELDTDAVDIADLIEGFDALNAISDMNFPPLYRESEFEHIDGFLAIEDDPIEDQPGLSFRQLKLYLQEDKVQEVLNQFENLLERMKARNLVPEYLIL